MLSALSSRIGAALGLAALARIASAQDPLPSWPDTVAKAGGWTVADLSDDGRGAFT